jgi:ankyrin repeat protein
MLKLSTSPLKVALQFVDASVMSCVGPNGDDGTGSTPLHWLAEGNDPSKEHTLQNHFILAQRLIEAGANVSARAQSYLRNISPLHSACWSGNCTNLDFIQLLLDHGANPNANMSDDETPLRFTTPSAPGAPSSCLRTRTRLIPIFS